MIAHGEIKMSMRGSFCTQYIYCEKCYIAALTVLLGDDKFLCSTPVPSWKDDDEPLPIIAGKIGGLGGADELLEFQINLIPALELIICHPIRIAVIPETEGEEMFFTAAPNT